jgi:uncharacterized membrane protein (UPF0127 family)
VAWLLRDGEVLASLELATKPLVASKGLLGRKSFTGAILLGHTRSVHTVGMRFSVDVAFLDKDHVVLDTVTLSPLRVALPRWRAHSVLEAESGAFERWRLQVGDQLEVRT